jgi:hypothetical protein
MAMKVTIDVLWFKISAVMGMTILIISAFIIYKAIMVIWKARVTKPSLKYDILKHMN